MISYEGIDEAVLVHALHHGTQAIGMGVFHDRPDLTVDDARKLIGQVVDGDIVRLDYLAGRPMKVSIDTLRKEFDPRLYDRDAGHGRAHEIVQALLATGGGR